MKPWQFEKELAALAGELQLLIEADCQGFKPSKEARAARIVQVSDPVTGFRFFCKNYFPHYVTTDDEAELHKWAYKRLPNRLAAEGRRLLAVAALRGEAKSTLISQLFTLWGVVTGQMHFPIIISDAAEQSWALLEGIKAELEYNPRLKMDFPEATGVGRVWKNGVIVTNNHAKLQAFGKTKRIRGLRHGPHRPDFVSIDDLENDQNVTSKDQRDKDERYINRSVLNLAGPDGDIMVLIVGTLLHYDSVLNRKLKSPTWESHVFKAIVRWPDRMELWDAWEEVLLNDGEDASNAFYEANREAMDKGAVISWPGMRSLLRLMTIRADDKDAFGTEMQQEPGAGDNAPFNGSMNFWVQVCRDWVFYGAVDPSLGKRGKRGDPAALLVGGYDREHGVLDVVAANVSRQIPTMIIQNVIQMQREFGCIAWAFESVQFQEFLREQLVKESAALGVHVPAIPVIPSTDKDLRILSLQPHCFNNLIRFDRRHTVLVEQVQHWPEADHDDGPDCLEMLWNVARQYSGMPQVTTARISGQTNFAGYD